MSRVVYSRHYNIGFLGLERLHPFDSKKYGRAYGVLKRHLGKRLNQVIVRPSGPVSREVLLKVHTAAYLRQLQDAKYVAAALELPQLSRLPSRLIDHFVLRPMRWAVQGTIDAAQLAIAEGFSVNLGGGFHHAKPFDGEGFCIYADIALAVHQARESGRIRQQSRIAYIDLDAHQGNGVSHTFLDDSRAFLFDMFNSDVYPFTDVDARERVDCPIALTSGCGDDEYFRHLQRRLPGFLDSIMFSQPVALAIYNAGTDVVAGDPLGQLKLSAEAILERDAFVVGALRDRGIPTVMLLSGGYTSASFQIVAESVMRLLASTNES